MTGCGCGSCPLRLLCALRGSLVAHHMQEIEVQQRFVQLRAEGRSYQQIAQELGVCKRTVVNWSHKFQYEINNQRAIEMEALQEALLSTREARARALAE